MKHLAPLVAPLAAAVLLTACGKKEEAPAPAPAAAPPATEPAAPATSAAAATAGATVTLAATQGHSVTGALTIVPMGAGVHFTGTLQGLPPDGEFGFHVHEKGDCSAPDASSAGGHLNPTGAEHGDPQGTARHAGDIRNAKSDAQGMAEINAHVDGLTLGDGGPADVVGKAVVVHEKADDYKSQPAGNSGARVACGVVTASASPSATPAS